MSEESPQYSELLTSRTIVAAFNQLCYATQSAVLEALGHLHEERRKAFYATQEPPPVKSIPLYDPKEPQRRYAEEQARLNPPRCAECGQPKDDHPITGRLGNCNRFIAKHPTRLATVEEMLKPHPHIGKSGWKS